LACPVATDEEALKLSTAAKVRIELHGDGRRLWLKGVSLVALALPDTDVAPPPPPLSTATDVVPEESCAFEERPRHRVPKQFLLDRLNLPCHTSPTACCLHARAHGMDAFLLNDAGCCAVVRVSGPSVKVPPIGNCFSDACMMGLLV
jgi:hypothetical protein